MERCRRGLWGQCRGNQRALGVIKGVVFEAFGEGSEDVCTLVQSLATSRARTVALQRGRECSEGELAVIVGEVRRSPECGRSQGSGRLPAQQDEQHWPGGCGCREEEAVGKVGGGKVAAGSDGPQGQPAEQQGGEEAGLL